MKIFTILMLCTAAYIGYGFPCEEGESPDFRFSDWGDSPAKVIANEELDLYEVNPAFLSDQTFETWEVIPDDGSRPELKSLIGDAPISVSYQFREGRLFKTVYFLALENIRAGYQRRLYSLVRKRLTEKYGQPTRELESTLRYWTEWVSERTIVKMNINLRSGINAASITFESLEPDVSALEPKLRVVEDF